MVSPISVTAVLKIWLIPVTVFSHIAFLVGLTRSQNVHPDLHAYDSQLCGNCQPGGTLPVADKVAHCVDLVASWMQSNRLCLNSDKTEV
jgi:hypothetical protein